MYNCTRFISMNVLMLEEERVTVAKGEDFLVRALKDWGCKPIECSFYDFESIGGGFHCASIDLRRRGSLKSYFQLVIFPADLEHDRIFGIGTG